MKKKQEENSNMQSSSATLRRVVSSSSSAAAAAAPMASVTDNSSRSHSSYDGLAPIVVKGYKFFDSNTKQNILIKGIDYYPRPNTGDLDTNSVDFFTEEYRHIWERDIPHFQDLGLNAIRLYAVDPDQDHSAFMCALNEAGIYVVVELASGSCPTCAITRDEAPHCYPGYLKVRGEKVIKEFSKYTNTLAFSAGNEVNHFVPLGKPPQWNAPCLKKFVRDMRAYVSRCDSIRHVPIGLIMADSDRDENTLYYNCQSDIHDDLEHAEWYGLNTYVYCNGTESNFDNSKGFKTLQESFESYHYSIPVLLTEYGCLSTTFPTIDGYEGQRNFNQAKWLGLKEVQDYFAGGLAFEYSIELANAQTPFPFKVFGKQNYGVGYLSPENCNDIDVMCEYIRMPSFYSLKKAYAQVEASNFTMDEFTPAKDRTGRTTCPDHFPKLSSFFWGADWRPSISCPSKDRGTFTCPARGSSNASDDSTAQTTTFPMQQEYPGATLLASAVLLLSAVYLLMKLLRKESMHYIRSSILEIWNDETEGKSFSNQETKRLVDSNHDSAAEYLSITASDSD